jgi:quercetin dioxygenase-like cupin family protein
MSKRSLALAIVALVVAAAGSAVAQQAASPAAPTVTRTPLRTQDLPMPGGYVATLVSVELPAGSREGRHMHSGTLIAYVKEGAITLDHEGKPTVTYKAGETFAVEPGKVHEGMNKGSVTTMLVATFVYPKDQPMTTQVTK